VLILSKYTSKIDKPKNSDMNELLNNNNEIEKHKSIIRKENNKQKEE
jgi:hypothetical protein